MQRFLWRYETGLVYGGNQENAHAISILFRRTMPCLQLYLSGFIVVKMKSHQQNCILIRLNKTIDYFRVRISFPTMCFGIDIHFENYLIFLTAPTKHENAGRVSCLRVLSAWIYVLLKRRYTVKLLTSIDLCCMSFHGYVLWQGVESF